MKIGCIIQARSGSSRLPNKVLLPLPFNQEFSVLNHVIDRVKKSIYINEIIVATTDTKADDSIAHLSTSLSTKVFRGSEKNVLSRYYESAKMFHLDIVVRITSDCPCIDPKVIDRIINIHLEHNNDYTSNTLARTFPHGMDAEVFNFSVLKEAFNNSTEDFEFEHVTPYIYKTKPDLYKIENVQAGKEQHGPEIRITLDTHEDYMAICAIFDHFKDKHASVEEIITLFKYKPWISYINKSVEQKHVYSSFSEELEKAIALSSLHGLERVQRLLESVDK